MAHPDQKEVEIVQADGALTEMVTRAEYDVQIATARKYPRSIKKFTDDAMQMVTLNESVADDCIYALPRKDKDGKDITIEGPSARFAEIILHAWGHTRAGARIVNEDDRFVTAQGVCHDLQSNTLICYEVRRRITNKSGRKFNDDMIGVTSNAAASIALRNAVTKVIPKAFWEPIYEEARKVVIGNAASLATRRQKALDHLQKCGASEAMVLKKLGVAGVQDISLENLVTLRGIATALKEGDTTVEQIFADDTPSGSAPTGSKTDQLKERLAGKKEQAAANASTSTSTSTAASAPAGDAPTKPNTDAASAAASSSGSDDGMDDLAGAFIGKVTACEKISELALLRHNERAFLADIEKKNPTKYNYVAGQFNERLSAVGGQASGFMPIIDNASGGVAA